jgi:hypothetical protein
MVNDATRLEPGAHVVTMRRGKVHDRDAMMLLEAPGRLVAIGVVAQALRESPWGIGERLVRPAMMIAKMRPVMMILRWMRMQHPANWIGRRGVN